MERKNFLKSLLTLLASPKLIKDIQWEKPKTATQLFNEQMFIVPVYYPDLLKKYGNEKYTECYEQLGNEAENKIYYFYVDKNITTGQ